MSPYVKSPLWTIKGMMGTQEWSTQSKPRPPGDPPKPTRSRWATLRGGSNDHVPPSNSARRTERPGPVEQLCEAHRTTRSYWATLWGRETQSMWPPDTHASRARLYPTNQQDRHYCPTLAMVGHVATHVSSWMTLWHDDGMTESFWQQDGASPCMALGAPPLTSTCGSRHALL